MKAAFTRFLVYLLVLLGTSLGQSVMAQTGVLDPNDPVVIYDPNNPPKTPPANTLVKWVKTTRFNWSTNSYKCYFYNGIAFRLKFPKSYQSGDDGKTYPLYLFFHGVGEKGTIYDNEFQLYHGGQLHMNAVDNGTFDGFLLYPQTSSGSGGWSQSQIDAMAQLITNYLIPQVKVDPNRIIVNGLSGGGGAAWLFLEHHPQLTAAAIPMSAATTQDVPYISSLVYNPIWMANGGKDDAPSPYTANLVVNEAQKDGADFVHYFYSTLGHNTWDSTWKEPDYFPYMLRANKTNPWPLRGRTEYCPSDPIRDTLGVTAGFDGYQWRKDGTVISGATSNTYIATSVGTYDCRVLRGSTWSYWSPIPVVISIKTATVSPDIQVQGLASNVLPAPDGSTTVNLTVPGGYASYTWERVDSPAILSSTTNVLSGATPGSYAVKVTEQYGCSSSFSNPFTVVNANGPNPPEAPTGLLATTLSQTQVRLNWSENASQPHPETKFEIYKATVSDGPYTLAGFSAASVDSFIATNLASKTRFYFKVRAVNGTGASATTAPSSALTLSDVLAPTAPGNLQAGNVSQTSVQLIWDASTDNVGVVNYDIYINGHLSYTIDGDENSFTAYNLTDGQFYTFVVKARDLAGNVSNPSNQLVAAAAFSGLNYKYYTFTGTWNALPDFSTLTPVATGNVPNVTIDNRTQDDNFAYLWEGFIQIPVNGTYTFRTNSDDGSRLYLGSLNQSTSPYSYSATPLVNNDGLHGTQNRNGTITLTAGVYPIAITYYEQGGGQSITVSWRTPQTGSSYVTIPDNAFRENVTSPGSAPAAPQGLVATAASAKKINLSWQDKSNNETGFELYRSTSANGIYNIVATTGANKTSYGDSSLEAATTYYYKVHAIGQYGASDFNAQDSSILSYNYYGNFTSTSLTGINSLTPTSTGTVNNFDLGVSPVTTNYALQFNGYINITTAGTYTFYTNSDDGSNLYIDGSRIVNNDGSHGTTEKSGNVSLTKGRHKIQVNYFQGGGGYALTVSYKGPSIAKVAIPDNVLNIPPANATTQALPAIPLAPSGLAGTVVSPNKISLTWTDNANASNVVRYEVWRSPATNANYELAANLGNTATAYVDSGLTASTLYYYKVRAVNEGGNSNYSNEINKTTPAAPITTVTVNTIANQNMTNDVTLAVNVSATTDLGTSLALTASGLPAFATLTDNGNGTAVITLKPGSGDLGTYSITVKATDNYNGTGSKTFTLTVSGKNQVTIDVNFNQTLPQGSPWNNTNSAPNAGLTVSGFKDLNGNNTGAGLTLLNTWTGANAAGMSTGNNSGVFPDNVEKTIYFGSNNTPYQFRVTGLSTSKKYSFVFYGGYPWSQAQFAQYGGLVGNYSIGSQTVTLDAANNTANTVQINNVSPDASGNVVVSCVKATGNGFVILNAMQILSYDAADSLSTPYNLKAYGISTSKINLTWSAASDTRTGFQVWRSSTPNGTYSLLASVSGTASSYVDAGLAANSTYFYEVRAVNNAKYSAFSAYAGGSTVAYVVNLNFNAVPTVSQTTPDWNNLNALLADNFSIQNLNNSNGQSTGINMNIVKNLDGFNGDVGVTTGNNSGVVPDNVMKTLYYENFGDSARFSISGLNKTGVYNLVFFAGTIYNSPTTTVYGANGQLTSINALNNTTVTTSLNGLKPDSTGTILVTLYPTLGYGFINSLTIQAMPSPDALYDSSGILGAARIANASQDAINQRADLMVTAESAGAGLHVYPNPFVDNVTLKFDFKQNVSKFTVQLIDLSGRIVQQHDFFDVQKGTWQQTISLGRNLGAGTYFIRLAGIPGEEPKAVKLLKGSF